MKLCSDIRFLHITGLFRHQLIALIAKTNVLCILSLIGYAQIFWLSGLVFRALILTCFIRAKFKIYLLFQICDLQIYDIAFKALAKFRQKKRFPLPLYLAFDLALMTKMSSLHHSKRYLNQIYYFGSVFNLNWSIMEKLFIVMAHLQFGQPFG